MPSRVDFEPDSRSIQAQLVEHQFPGKKSGEIESRIDTLYVDKLTSKITFRIANRDTRQIEAWRGEKFDVDGAVDRNGSGRNGPDPTCCVAPIAIPVEPLDDRN